MNIEYKIVKENKLIIHYFSGKVLLNDLFNSIKIVINDVDFDPHMSVLNDLRDCEIITDTKSIYELTEYVKNNKKLYAKRKTAFLTNSPKQVVFSTLLINLKNEPLVSIKIVSTIESALKHLKGNTYDYELVNNIINKLKSKWKNS